MLIGFSVITPVAGTITYLVFSISKNKKDSITNFEKQQELSQLEEEQEENDNFFPTLNQSSFYDYLVLSEGKPIITNKLISNVIKYVIPRINTTNEKVNWSYKLSGDKTNCLFYFEAKEDEKTYKKEYFFDVNMLD